MYGQNVIKQSVAFTDAKLSAREEEVFDLLIKGLCSKQISEILGCTLRTVKAHITSIFSKFDVTDRNFLFALIIEELYAIIEK